MIGLGFVKVTCLLCQNRARRRDARRAQNGTKAHVCERCYTAWEKSGRRCVACNTAVRGLQYVGLFVDRRGLGHADCGGVRLLRA